MNQDLILALIVLLPLVGSALGYLVGIKNRELSPWIATFSCFLSFVCSVIAVSTLNHGTLNFNFFSWFNVGELSVDLSLFLDPLNAVMVLVVTGIGSLIHLYSIAYMKDDESKHRFFAYLNLFMFSMLLLILGSNLLVLFVGWEGVGLCSYLLIGFWYTNTEYAKAGKKAFIVNRIGDAGFLLGMFLVFWTFKTLDFQSLAALIPEYAATGSLALLTLIALFFFIGATGKSAQIPLFVWLPDAMAGPTPVSALIHAATMVTAGVYLLARMNFLIDLVPYAQSIIVVIATLTAFIAATTALVQNDIKKVLAYSTVSQLGFMFLAAGSGAYWVAIFHVVTHAFFKACLFLGAGSVIHACHHEQDMRQMGGLRKYMPITFWTYLISVLAISGIAPFAGYYSKHAIMQSLAENSNVYLASTIGFIIPLITITAILTAFYMTRSLVMTFFGEYRGHAHPHESPILLFFLYLYLCFLILI
ncbi:UNVERIFIED_CONTAM: hypothetical protein GTU68_027800 [Idotea baltica]|nr:hypothetical protein [Idotea baltica]